MIKGPLANLIIYGRDIEMHIFHRLEFIENYKQI